MGRIILKVLSSDQPFFLGGGGATVLLTSCFHGGSIFSFKYISVDLCADWWLVVLSTVTKLWVPEMVENFCPAEGGLGIMELIKCSYGNILTTSQHQCQYTYTHTHTHTQSSQDFLLEYWGLHSGECLYVDFLLYLIFLSLPLSLFFSSCCDCLSGVWKVSHAWMAIMFQKIWFVVVCMIFVLNFYQWKKLMRLFICELDKIDLKFIMFLCKETASFAEWNS